MSKEVSKSELSPEHLLELLAHIGVSLEENREEDQELPEEYLQLEESVVNCLDILHNVKKWKDLDKESYAKLLPELTFVLAMLGGVFFSVLGEEEIFDEDFEDFDEDDFINCEEDLCEEEEEKPHQCCKITPVNSPKKKK